MRLCWYKVKCVQRDTKVNQHNKNGTLSSLSQPDIVVTNTTERFLKKTPTRTMHSTLYEISVTQHLTAPHLGEYCLPMSQK